MTIGTTAVEYSVALSLPPFFKNKEPASLCVEDDLAACEEQFTLSIGGSLNSE